MGKIILAVICALSLTFSACEKRETKKPSEVKSPEATGIISNKVPQQVADVATGPLTDLGKDPIVVEAVKTQNALGQTKAEIKAMDKEWQAAKKEGKTEPFMKALMENPCAKQLNKIMTEHPFITEIFVTDNQGANVCQTGLTGDYWQGDEAKFKEVFKKGILVSHPKVEDGMNITQVSVPVLMKKRHIGTMTIGVDIDKVPVPEAAKPEAEKPEAAPAVAEQAAPTAEEAKEAVAEPQQEEATEAAAAPAVATEKVEEAVEEKAAAETQEEAVEKEKPVVEEAEAQPETLAKAEPAKTPEAAPEQEPAPAPMEEAEKATQQVEEAEEKTEEATRELESLPAQVEKVQRDAEAVKEEVVKVAAQVKMVSAKVQRVSENSRQVMEKARKAMDKVVQARAQLRDAADQIQKAAALMTEQLAEIELLSGEEAPK